LDLPRPRPPILPNWFAVSTVLTLGAGLAATVILALGVLHLEQEKQALAFSQQAGIRTEAIRRGLDQAAELAAVTNALFQSVSPVTRTQFHDFTAPLLARNRFIKSFSFHRRISDAERDGFEAELARLYPGVNSNITEVRDGRTQTALHRPSYMPVDFIEPGPDEDITFGFDAGRSKSLQAAIERAIDNGRPAATALLMLSRGPQAQRGFLMAMPVYRHDADLSTPALRRAAMIGNSALIMRAAELVEIILAGQPVDDGLQLTVAASGSGGRMVTVYPRAAPSTSTEGVVAVRFMPSPSWLVGWRGVGALPHHVTNLDVGGQPWRIDVTARARPMLSDHLGSLLVLVGGAMLTLLLTALVESMTQRSRRVEKLVQERTADLELSNQRLVDDVIERQRAEKALQESEQRFRQLVSMSSDWYWEQDADGKLTHSAGPVHELLGIGKGEADGWNVEQRAALDANIANRQPFLDLIYTRTLANGSVQYLQVSGEPIFDDASRFAGYRGIGMDVTARMAPRQAKA